jgi:6-phosphogluconolactonase
MERREFISKGTVGLAGITVAGLPAFSKGILEGIGRSVIYVGTYTDKRAEGINLCDFGPSTGSLSARMDVIAAENPSFLALSPDGNLLFAVKEVSDFRGTSGGAVSAWKIDKGSGSLTFINSQPSLGADPCHLTVSLNGKFVLVANYTGGNVAVLPVAQGGTLGEAVCVKQHSGQGPNTSRQEKPHAHSINLSPDNQYAYACDLGIDKIMIYRFDAESGQLTSASVPFFQTAPGAGPRHFCFSPDGRHAFVINELNSTITALSFESSSGSLREIQTLSTLPNDFKGENTCADVHVHPNGRFLYGSNRGHDSIAVFSLDQKTGALSPAGHQPVGGITPRNFLIVPSGEYLLVANQNSNTINVYKINQANGMLTPTGQSAEVPQPVCIVVTDDR